MVCSETAEEGKQWVEAINTAVQQLKSNLRTLRKESSSRKPLRKKQLKRTDSLLQKFSLRRPEAGSLKRPFSVFDVDVLRSDHENMPSPETPKAKSPRILKLPKWPTHSSGSQLVLSPLRLLTLKLPMSPKRKVS